MYNGRFENSSEAWAWAAGLFEGEGCITHRKYKRGHPAYGHWMRGLVVAMTDEDPVRLFHEIAGAGRVRFAPPPKASPHWSPTWRWECTDWENTERILSRLLPMLGERRARDAQALLANPAKFSNPRGKTHCLRGHPLSGENLYMCPSAQGPRRVCRTCQRARWTKYDQKRRAMKKPRSF